MLQRVIGMGGDHVAQRPGGPVTVNGKPLAEPYVMGDDPFSMTPAFDVVVPEGRLFLLGDYRANANDSRFFLSEQSGTVAATEVQARALDNRTGLFGLAPTALLGLLLTLGALVVQIAAWGARQRSLPEPVPLNPDVPVDAQPVWFGSEQMPRDATSYCSESGSTP